MFKLRTFVIISCFVFLFTYCVSAQTTQIYYLSGKGSDDTVQWEFMVSGGRQSGEWLTIPVPSNWEMQGFGTYHYSDDWSEAPAPDSVGLYRYHFRLSPAWKDKAIDVVFGGSMTDTELKINGHLAGPVHQGGFYQFRYNITDLLLWDQENLLEVKVRKFSTNTSINQAERQADFWLFGGIFRPVWLEARPLQHIDHIALDARHDGSISIGVNLNINTSANRVTAQIYRLNGEPLGESFSTVIVPGSPQVVLHTRSSAIQQWSPEWPNLYNVKVQLRADDIILHQVTQKFGFRTVEVRPHDGLYVNGVKVRIKGINRHSFWPTSGRTTNKKISITDAMLIKDMNMNAVRMSHYPPDSHFLDAADSLGLFIIDEFTGWQASYDTDVGAGLVKEFIFRDMNHPSVILWANGNEGGWNTELDDDFTIYDPQKRTVIHPWEFYGDINTSHYEMYDCCSGKFFHGNDLIMPTEFLHGLYDGGLGAGLDDWWRLILDTPLAIGGFLWAFADEGILRSDRHDSIDVAGNRAPDGVVGPYREKEGSFFAVKEIWSPIYFSLSETDRLPSTFTGEFRVENRYDFTNLNQVKFNWKLVDFPSPAARRNDYTVSEEGTVLLDAEPHSNGILFIPLPETWREHDGLYLTAVDPHGREVYCWTWMIPEPKELVDRFIPQVKDSATGTSDGNIITLSARNTKVEIDMRTGRLKGINCAGQLIPLYNGPRLVSGKAILKKITHHAVGQNYIVEAHYDGDLLRVTWCMLPSGWLRLDYKYSYPRHTVLDYMGVTFDFPESQVTDIRWLGRGPYRVWKNRSKGTEFNVWSKKFNNAITGLRWEYPEFKGFHEDIYWATLETKALPITMIIASNDIFLRLFTPEEAPQPRNTHVNFPPGDISFLQGIVPIGTKFHPASAHGPAGAPNMTPRNEQIYEVRLVFYFGRDLPEVEK